MWILLHSSMVKTEQAKSMIPHKCSRIQPARRSKYSAFYPLQATHFGAKIGLIKKGCLNGTRKKAFFAE
jgi:hypothetical protein